MIDPKYDSVDNYLKLIPPMNAGKPKFVAFLTAILQPMVDCINFLSDLNTPTFDIDTAIGAQLDVLGVILARSRYINAPVAGVYFSFGIAGVGFGQGYWKGQFDPSDGLIRLDDDTYRVVLKFKIAANQWDGSVNGLVAVYALLGKIVGPGVFVQDNQDMSITIGIAGTPPNSLIMAVMRQNYLILKPEGVRIAGYKISSTGAGPLFGFGMNNNYVAGFGTGSWAIDG